MATVHFLAQKGPELNDFFFSPGAKQVVAVSSTRGFFGVASSAALLISLALFVGVSRVIAMDAIFFIAQKQAGP
jgi:hypothetical protein